MNLVAVSLEVTVSIKTKTKIMENKKIGTLVLVLVIGLILGRLFSMAGFRHVCPMHAGIHQMPDGKMMSNGSMMNDSMGSMMTGLNGKTGEEFDQAFLSEMIIHHEGAVEMAQAALKNARHQELKDMANVIISAQTKEIGQMRDWQSTWYNQ
ncbi:MAG: uncharacterized protein JWM14_2781 [Chitinophagaceae bacterium]|nr:uncharacterized protein [Chitinophagaceae bacterium]